MRPCILRFESVGSDSVAGTFVLLSPSNDDSRVTTLYSSNRLLWSNADRFLAPTTLQSFSSMLDILSVRHAAGNSSLFYSLIEI